MGWFHSVAGKAISIFSPTIITSFGYTNVDAVLFAIPINTAAIIWGGILAVLADRYQHRCILLCINTLVCGLGIALAGFDLDYRNIRLGGLFLGTMGTHPHNLWSHRMTKLMCSGNFTAFPLVVGWFTANNIGNYRRSVALASIYAIQGTGTFVGAFTFVSQEAPRYLTGYTICLAAQGMAFIFTLIYTAALWAENRAKDLGKREHLRTAGNLEELGDRHVLSLYRWRLTCSLISDLVIRGYICQGRNDCLGEEDWGRDFPAKMNLCFRMNCIFTYTIGISMIKISYLSVRPVLL
jgi:hypothetical protein